MENSPTQLNVNWQQFIGARAEQQDACDVSAPAVLQTKGLLAVLADGMGGMNAGADYSRIATQVMVSRFENEPLREDPALELLSLFQAAQQEALAAHPGENEGGATVAAVLIRNGQCVFLSCGDSRIYLVRGGGLIQLNREHTLGATLDERAALGYLPEEDALYNTRRAALTNHLGMAAIKTVDRNLHPFKLLPGDRLALMSDGVFNTVSDDVMEPLLAGSFGLAVESVLQRLAAAANPRQDNASLLLIGNEPINARK